MTDLIIYQLLADIGPYKNIPCPARIQISGGYAVVILPGSYLPLHRDYARPVRKKEGINNTPYWLKNGRFMVIFSTDMPDSLYLCGPAMGYC